MLKLRLMGTPEDIAAFTARLGEIVEVLEESGAHESLLASPPVAGEAPLGGGAHQATFSEACV